MFEVALGRGLAAERVGLVGVAHVLGVAVEVGVHRDRRDAELAARAHHADRDLTSVRDQDLREQAVPRTGRRGPSTGYGRPYPKAVSSSGTQSTAAQRVEARVTSTRFGPVQWFDRVDSTNRVPPGRGGAGRARRPGGGRRRADRGPGPARAHVDRAARRIAPRVDPAAAAARAGAARAGDDGGRPRRDRCRARGRRDRRPGSSGRTTSSSTTASSPGSSPEKTGRRGRGRHGPERCVGRVPGRAAPTRDRLQPLLDGAGVDRDELLAQLLVGLDARLDALDGIVDEARAASATLGRRVRVEMPGDSFDADAVDLTAEGHLARAARRRS